MKKRTDGKPILSSRRSFGRRVIAGAPVLGAAFLTGTALAQDPEPDEVTIEEITQEAIESEVRSLVPPSSEKDQLNGLIGTGYVYRHNFGYHNGIKTLNLSWSIVEWNSLVFVSISQAMNTPRNVKMMGDANFVLYNVASNTDIVSIRINVHYHMPLPVLADFLVINP